MNFKNLLSNTGEIFEKVMTLREHDGRVEVRENSSMKNIKHFIFS